MAKILPVRCQACGQYIGYDDLINGKAIHKMLTPDAYGTAETWEHICPRCKENDEQQ